MYEGNGMKGYVQNYAEGIGVVECVNLFVGPGGGEYGKRTWKKKAKVRQGGNACSR